MKKKIEFNIERVSPPGINIKAEYNAVLTGIICSLLFGMMFFIRYFNAYSQLFVIGENGRELVETAKISSFSSLWGSSAYGFYIVAVTSLFFAVYHYAYFYQDTKSIYLMKRLPSRFELHYRCLTMPILYFCICIALALIMMLLCFALYMIITPSRCIPPNQWKIMWENLL